MSRLAPLFVLQVLLSLAGCVSAPAQPAPPPPVQAKPLDAKAQKIELLLGRADTALSMQALTEPASENAYDL
ncbi:MAG TPA: hypothetical protein PK011_02180, partial [Marinagarivorans sp.]|nr:hypothetical protein [Marinagarivorans sp.]